MVHPVIVSVIVPCFNQGRFLSETLDSVLSQTYSNWECIIVNDGSVDNTESVASHYCAKDSRFRYLFQENRGLSSARNIGIANSTGEYILPLDADDLIDSEFLEKTISCFLQIPKIKLVTCRVQKFGYENIIADLLTYSYEDLLFKNPFVCTSLYRRIDFEKTGGYDISMRSGYEDWDFWLRLLDKDDIVCQIDEVLFYYRTKEKSMLVDAEQRDQELLRVIYHNHKEKYEPFAQNIVSYLREIQYLRSSRDYYKNSTAYRVGVKFLRPWVILRHLFSKRKRF